MLGYKDYEHLFKTSQDAFVRIDDRAKIVEVNDSFIDLFKYSRDVLIGKPLDDFVVRTLDMGRTDELIACVQMGSIFNTVCDRVDGSGTVYQVIITGAPLLVDGAVRGAVVVYKNISLEIKANTELLKQKMTFESLFRNSNDAIVRIDIDQRVLDINERFSALFGYRLEEIRGETVDRLIASPQKLQESVSLTDRLLHGEKVMDEGMRFGKNMTSRIYIIQGVPIIAEGEVIGGYGIYTDVTESRTAEKRIASRKVAYEALFRNSSDAIVHFNKHHEIIDINENFTELFKYTLEEIVGRHIDDVVSGDGKITESSLMTNRLLSGEKVVLEGIRYDKYGREVEVGVKGVPIISEGEVIGGYGIYADISMRRAAEREILYMSYHDQLTGLYNRRYFETELTRLDNERSLPISIVMADVNGLKLINDAFGHEAGDEFLRRMAGILRETCRQGEIIARLGGDEFVLLLPQTTVEEAGHIVERIKATCHRAVFRNIAFSMSFGYGAKTDLGESIGNLFKRVEDQMYRNKLDEGPGIQDKLFNTVVQTVHSKNEREEVHSTRVSYYCGKMAEYLQMSTDKVKEMKMAGWLHDIGKIAVSDYILDKTEALTSEEWNEVKKHPEIGYRILNSVNEFTELAQHILLHHEWYDGQGYPKGLAGEAIPLEARIIAVADAYVAMTSERTFRKAMTQEEAVEEIMDGSGSQFDPSLVDVLFQVLECETEDAYAL